MKKSLLGGLLCVLMVTTLLIGCGNKNNNDWTEEKEETKTVEEIAEESVSDRFKLILSRLKRVRFYRYCHPHLSVIGMGSL